MFRNLFTTMPIKHAEKSTGLIASYFVNVTAGVFHIWSKLPIFVFSISIFLYRLRRLDVESYLLCTTSSCRLVSSKQSLSEHVWLICTCLVASSRTRISTLLIPTIAWVWLIVTTSVEKTLHIGFLIQIFIIVIQIYIYF